MIDNHHYNLMKALTKKSQGLWRYDQYLQDSNGCAQCQEIWQSLKAAETEQLQKMTKALVDHMKAM